MLCHRRGFILIFFYLFVSFVFAEIDSHDFQIDIDADTEKKELDAITVGRQISLLTDKDKKTWEIMDDNLRAYAKKYFDTDNIVQLNLLGSSTQIVYPAATEKKDFKKKSVALAKRKFENDFRAQSSFVAGLTQEVSNEISTTWTRSESFSVDYKISVSINFGIFSIGGSVSFGYDSSWGSEETKTEKTTVGASSTVSVSLDPGQSGYVILKANKAEAKLLITYGVVLKGTVYVKLGDDYLYDKEHYIDINWLLDYSDKPTKRNATEEITLSYYSDTTITVVKEGDKILETFAPEKADHQRYTPPPNRPDFKFRD